MDPIYLMTCICFCLLGLQSISSYQSITYTSCDNVPRYVYGSDSVSVTWNIRTGTTACVLSLSFLSTRKFSVRLTSNFQFHRQCSYDTSGLGCNTGNVHTICPAVMYSLSSLSNFGTILDNYKTTYLTSSFIKLKHCGDSTTSTVIKIEIDAISSSSTSYWYWSSSWLFVCIGIPIIGVSATIFFIGLYIWHRQRRNRIQMQQQQQQTMVTAQVTTCYTGGGGGVNPGYQTVNEPYVYPQQQPAAYNNVYPAPPAYNPTGYIQGPEPK